ncbi:MAG TPA: GNAT family protein [Candidatus Goldiibacteriota bacterium]|nr:GNAT family protein [Candidatus Goldiibacteriota bacterium]HRQ44146.1 GNAT family protein [Candidatus Goldiibacteriota bacterium]
MILKGKKAVLRTVSVEDTDNIIRWRNTDAVRNNFVFRSLLTKKVHLQWMSEKVAKKKVYQFIIVDAKENKDVGSVYLRDVDRVNRHAEFGIFIGEPSARGKGLGAEAARLITDFAFNKLKLNRIFLRVFSDNVKAIKSYKAAGFKTEGIFREHYRIGGQYKDMTFMGRLKGEK